MTTDPKTLDIAGILSVLPHRYPFLLVDRVLDMVPGERLTALKNVTINEPFFGGHFPGHPVMPGVLVVEGLAQAAGILLLHDRPDREESVIYFTAIDRARFRRPVVPGDQLRYEVEVVRLRSRYARLSAQAFVEGEIAAEGVFSSAMVSR